MAKKDREARREKMRQRMADRSQNLKDGGGRRKKPLFDFSEFDEKPKWYNLKEGKNTLDIIPFPVARPDIVGQGTEKDEEFYVLLIPVHTNIGPKNERCFCPLEGLGKPCPICEAKQDLLDSGSDWNDDDVKALHVKIRCFYNVVDLDNPDEGVILFEQSEWWFDKELVEKANYKGEEFVTFADLEFGKTVTFRGTKSSFKNKKGTPILQPKDFDFEDRDPYKEDILEETYPLDELLIIHDYDTMRNMLLGLGGEENGDGDSGDGEPSGKTSRKSKSNTAKSSSSRRGGRKAKKEEPETESQEEPEPGEEDIGRCPYGHNFGIDCDETDACNDCDDDTFKECEDRYHELKEEEEAAKKAEEEAKKKESSKSSRRGGGSSRRSGSSSRRSKTR